MAMAQQQLAAISGFARDVDQERDEELGAKLFRNRSGSSPGTSTSASSPGTCTSSPGTFASAGEKVVSASPATASPAPGQNDYLKYGVLIFLVLQNSGASLLMRGSRTAGDWNPQTAVIMQEAIKGWICVFLLLRSGGVAELMDAVAPSMEALKTSVPAILFLFQNNMQYVAVGYLDAATFSVLYQFKILTAGVMSVLILKKALSVTQWVALVLLTGGASVVIVSQMSGTSAASSMGPKGMWIGVAAVMSACLASGCAGVYFEFLLKGSTMSLWARNLQLASYSMLIGLISLYQGEGFSTIASGGFFRGYAPIVWAAVFNNAGGGLLIAIVIKHADNILKNFSTTLSIVLTTGVSTVMLGTPLHTGSVAGTALVLYAVFLYGGMSGLETIRTLPGAVRARSVALVQSAKVKAKDLTQAKGPSQFVDCDHCDL